MLQAQTAVALGPRPAEPLTIVPQLEVGQKYVAAGTLGHLGLDSVGQAIERGQADTVTGYLDPRALVGLYCFQAQESLGIIALTKFLDKG